MGMYPSNLFVMRNQIYILKCLDYFAVIVCVLLIKYYHLQLICFFGGELILK